MTSRAELLRELEASRTAIARDYAAVRHAADFPSRAKSSVRRYPIPWLGGAAFLGWLLAGRKRKKVKASSKQGAKDNAPTQTETVKSLTIVSGLLAALRILLPILKPTITALAAKKFADLAGKLT